MIVLDASAALELLLGTRAGARVAGRIGEESLHAPHLLDLEVAQALRRYEASRAVDAGRAADALRNLPQLGIQRYAHEPFLPRVWQLRRNVTAYDAVYLAIAEALGAPLLTMDRRLATAPGHRACVETL